MSIVFKQRMAVTVLESVLTIHMTTIQKKCSAVDSRSWSLKLLIISLACCTLILCSLMRAMLSASLVIKAKHKPASSFSDIDKANFKINYEINTSYQQLKDELIRQHPYLDDNFQAKLFDNPCQFNPEELCMSAWFEFSDLIVECLSDIEHLDIHLPSEQLGIIYTKDWPYTKLLNYHIQRFFELGLIGKSEKEMVPKAI